MSKSTLACSRDKFHQNVSEKWLPRSSRQFHSIIAVVKPIISQSILRGNPGGPVIGIYKVSRLRPTKELYLETRSNYVFR